MFNSKWHIPVALAMFLLSIVADGIEIVKDGRPNTAIIIPTQALRATTMAAEELQTHIRLASGAKLEIYPESAKPKGFAGLIYVGPCKAAFAAGVAKAEPPVNYFAAKTVGNDLFLFGDDRDALPRMKELLQQMRYMHSGSAFAVYEFLERKLNVHWLWPGDLGVKIDKKKSIDVVSLDFSGQPRFLSGWFVPRIKESQLEAWSSLASKSRFEMDTFLWLRRCRYNLAECMMFDHSFGDYWKRFGKSQPEFFNLLPDGTRRPLIGDEKGQDISMCVSNPDLIKQKIADWTNPEYKSWFKIKRPGLRYICASENDTPGMCICKNCRAMDEQDPCFKTSSYWSKGIIPSSQHRWMDQGLVSQGDTAPSLAMRYARYYLNLYEAAKKINPDVILVGYAYANYRKPPKGHIKLNDHIRLCIVPDNAYPADDKAIRTFQNDWDGWAATGAQLVFRPNLPGLGHNMPISYVRWAYDSITHAYKSGRMYGSMIDSLLGEWGIQGFSYYVIGRLNINPETPLQQIYDEYCSAFGPAAGAIENYWRYWEKVSNAIDIKTYRTVQREKSISWKKWLPIAPLIFTPEVMQKGRELLEVAKAVSGLGEDEKKRIEFLDLGLQNAERTLTVLNSWNEYLKNKSVENRKNFACNLRDLYNFRKSIDILGLSNTGYLYLREGWTWEKSLLQYASPGIAGISFQEYRPGSFPAKETGWSLEGKDKQKYQIAELGKVKVFRLTASANSDSNCKASRILLDKGSRNLECSIVMGWGGDSKDGIMSRILIHANNFLWKGLELGFIRKNRKVFAAYRDDEIWRTMDSELKPDVLYRFEIKSMENGEKVELGLADENDVFLESKCFKPHGGASTLDTITLMLSNSGKEKKPNILFVKSIKAIPRLCCQ